MKRNYQSIVSGQAKSARVVGQVEKWEELKMRIKALSLLTTSVSLAICLAVPAFGQSSVTVSMPQGATGTGIWSDSPDGAVYTGIYTGTVSGLPGANPGIICDDYGDTVTPPETWTAKAYQVSSLNSTNIGDTMFGSKIGLQGYLEVATLVSYMFSGNSGYTANELSSAIWDITSGGKISASDSVAMNLVKALTKQFGSLTDSATEALLAKFGNLFILTPSQWSSSRPQEMWVSVAEGGAALMYLLLGALFCFGAFFKRNQGRLTA